MQHINDALWILMFGMILEIIILVFIVVFVIGAKVWMIKSFNHCMSKIKELENELDGVKKASINITQIKETLADVEKLLKTKK